ncbi:MAG: hypothetical protein AB1439_04395 [candidate division FCPU426 bacterium]
MHDPHSIPFVTEELQKLCRQLSATGQRTPWPVAQAYSLHRSTSRLAKAVLHLASARSQKAKTAHYQNALAAARAAEVLLERPLDRHWLARRQQRHLRRDLACLTELLLRIVASLQPKPPKR